MAVLGSISMAGLGLESSKLFRSTFLGSASSSEISRPSYPLRFRTSTRKIETGGQRLATTCSIKVVNQSSSVADQPPSPTLVGSGTSALPTKTRTSKNKGWTDGIMDLEDQRLVSQLRLISTLASDRSETHHILSVQRDNWNSLFHSTVTMASVSAAVAAALNGVQHALGLSVVASVLGLGMAALVALINFFQPTQLAEEQRHAARFFKRLATDIESTLETDPRLRQEASHYLTQKLATLHALDGAFPMPLSPIVLEKFPKLVTPSILSGPRVNLLENIRTSSQSTNGWTPAMEKDLKRTSEILHTSDIPAYVELATGIIHLNKTLAVASTVMAMSGALCNIVNTPIVGGALTVASFFTYSLSHAVQLGAVYETYRNCAGFYADVERSIETALRTPVEQRENGSLFLEKISLQLGRSPAESPLVPFDQKTAGTLF